jgi:hypothetical protein
LDNHPLFIRVLPTMLRVGMTTSAAISPGQGHAPGSRLRLNQGGTLRDGPCPARESLAMARIKTSALVLVVKVWGSAMVLVIFIESHYV